MSQEPTSLQFHIFGDLWLEDPKLFLDKMEMSELDGYMTLIQALGKSWVQRKPAFESTSGQLNGNRSSDYLEPSFSLFKICRARNGYMDQTRRRGIFF